MSGNGKRPRLDDQGKSIRELELEIELARLRREAATPGHNDQGQDEPGPSGAQAVAAPQAPQPHLQSPMEAVPTTPAAQRHPIQPPAPQPLPLPALPPTPQPNAGLQGGRGGRGGRGVRVRNTGLTTVFVCVNHDHIFCQRCSFYEPSDEYWARQGKK